MIFLIDFIYNGKLIIAYLLNNYNHNNNETRKDISPIDTYINQVYRIYVIYSYFI
jgi:hypothetical protein